MAKKSSEKKKDTVDRDIKTLIQPAGHRCGVTIYKGQTENYKKILPEEYKYEPGFAYSSQASWKTETQTPVYNRKTEQQFTDTQDILCSIPAFRQEIIQLRDQLASRSIYLGQIAAQVCSAWKIPNGKPWIEWLLTHWDPVTTTYPPHFSPTPTNSFLPWTIELNYLRETKGWPEACRTATITLNAGVSGREATRIAMLAQKALDRSKVKRGRPSPSNLELDALRSEFVKLGIPRPGKRTAMILKVKRACTESGNVHFSKTFIGNELRRWLREQKQTVRRYVTEPSS